MTHDARSPALLPLLTAAEMQRWDEGAIRGRGIPERVLMESAGRAAARVLHALYPRGRVVAAVGRGNNGGDAVVMLRTLRAWGREVVLVPVGGGEGVEPLLHGWELAVAPEEEMEAAFRGADVLVDGILGTGARGAPRPPQARAVRALDQAGAPVVALDGPTGVDLTTGEAPGDAVRAALTVTFGAPKRGHLLFPGREHAGRLVVVEVGFPPLEPAGATAYLATAPWAAARLPRLPANAHKGTAGYLTLVAGRADMGGAPLLVAMGALRAGTGMVRVVSAAENRAPLHAAVPEALFVDRGGDGVEGALEAADALVAGPAMGTDDAAAALLRRVVERGVPTLLDADALTLLSRDPALLPRDPGRFLLTPHPAEMARLMATETREVVADPFRFASAAAERFGCVVLLKGAPSLVAAPGEPVLASAAGHSGIATGGMGDTLAGVAGALLGMGSPPREAAALALHFAGRAAELAGRGRSLLPRDVAEALPAALAGEGSAAGLDLPEVLLDLPPAR